MKKIILTLSVLAVAFAACKKDGGVGPQGNKDDAAFVEYEAHFLDEFWKLQPEWATSEGYHKYDSLLTVPNSSYHDKLIKFAKVQLDSLGRFDIPILSDANKMDYKIMQNQFDKMIWEQQQLKQYEWDPSLYNVVGTFAVMLNEPYEPLANRLRTFGQRLEQVPAYYKEAEKQIKNPVPELTELAISQNLGSIDVFGEDLADSLKKSNLPEAEKKQITDRAKLATDAIKGYADWLKAMKNDHPRSFRLGKSLYEDKFKYEIQSLFTAQQLYNAAMDRKVVVHHEMAKLSLKLWPKYFGTATMPKDTLEIIAKVIDTISAQHPEPDNFKAAIEKTLPKLSDFVNTNQLLTLDPTQPLKVRYIPGYMAGVATAGLTPAGPYEKNGKSYFEVSNLHGWPTEKAESFLREYNNYTLQILSIHEAIPGHYVQLLYSNKSPSHIKSVFTNGAMVEGWAVYGEQIMMDAGFAKDQPEMMLMWYKWHLRSVCNAILDYNVHNGTMPKQQAIDFLTHEAFQQKAEAEGKWNRVSVTSVQLDSYFAGYRQIMELREAYRRKMSDKYKVKDFNEKFLSYGSAPVKVISEAMMSEKLSTKQ